MKNFEKHLIREDASVIEAMKRLNDVPENLTLFVLDAAGRMVGTVTDGDIRRGLIRGLPLTAAIRQFMFSKFSSINGQKYDVREIRSIRRKGIQLLPVLNGDRQVVAVHDLKKHRSILPVECMIMAGGRGERLRPLTDAVPKPLLPIGDKPIIEHSLEWLVDYGIERTYIGIGYLGQQIVDHLGDGSSRGMKIQYVWETEPLGTAGALGLVDRFQSEYILLTNGDLFTDADLEDLYLRVIDQDAAMGIASVPYSVTIPYAILDEEENRVVGFKEKPRYTRHANAGIYLLKRDCIRMVPRNSFFNVTDLLQNLIDAREKVIHNPIIGYWVDIGRHEDYQTARDIAKHLDNGNHR